MSYFEKIPKFKNLRGKTQHDGWYKVYNKSVKTDIAIHHSLTKTGSSSAFASYHVGTLGWPEVAYHFVILKDGTVEWNHDLGVLSYHVGNSNYFSVGICLVGDFRSEEPTREQQDSLYNLHKALVKDLPNYKRTRGHNEFPGYSWKACPVFDYKAVIKGNKIGNVKAPEPKTYLERGDEGADVRALQSSLVKVGYKIAIDGDYGPATEKAVESFQKKYKLSVDGLAGPNTLKKLNEVIADLAKKEIEEEKRKEAEKKAEEKRKEEEKKKAEQAKKEEEDEMLDYAIVINTYNDYPAAELVALKHKAPIYPRKAISGEVAKHIIVVGGNKDGIKADKITVLAGSDRIETVKAVEKYIK